MEKKGGIMESDDFITCYAANEIGVLAAQGDKDAVRKLVALLASSSDKVRYAAFGWLSDIGDPETETALSEFREKPENAPLLRAYQEERAARKIAAARLFL